MLWIDHAFILLKMICRQTILTFQALYIGRFNDRILPCTKCALSSNSCISLITNICVSTVFQCILTYDTRQYILALPISTSHCTIRDRRLNIGLDYAKTCEEFLTYFINLLADVNKSPEERRITRPYSALIPISSGGLCEEHRP